MKKYDKLDPEFKKRWVEALRSGEYVQTRETLHDEKTGGFCCLGVACHLLGVDKELLVNKGYPAELSYEDDVNIDELPEVITDISGINQEETIADVLAEMNDGVFIRDENKKIIFKWDVIKGIDVAQREPSKSFLEIADYIEEHL